ncbi:MAG: FG-GAP repeat domain-containing protein [Acidobacteriota bacterium]
MTWRVTGWALLGLLLAGISPGETGREPASDHSGDGKPPAAIRVLRDEASETLLVPLRGTLLSYALPRSGDGTRDLLLLIGPGDRGNLPPDAAKAAGGAPAGLYRLVNGGSPRMVLVRDDLHPDDGALVALDLDHDGRDEILLESGGSLRVLPDEDGRLAAGAPAVLFTDPGLDLRREEPRDVSFPEEASAVLYHLDESRQAPHRGTSRPRSRVRLPGTLDPVHLRVTGLGVLKLYGPDPHTGEWRLQSRVPLPGRVHPGAAGLLLSTPQVRTVGVTPEGHALLAAGPVPYGGQRLRTTLIRVERAAAPVVQELWSRLPGAEEVSRSGYLLLDGEPALWVVTEDASEGMTFSGHHEHYRLFRLARDRTRAGALPALALEKLKAPQENGLVIGRDINGDGQDDLVIVSREDGVSLWSYLQRSDGSIRHAPRRQELKSHGRPLAFGSDLDGDEFPDLLVAESARFAIYAGRPRTDGGRQLVAPIPAWYAARRRPTKNSPENVACMDTSLTDLDGDGRREIACAGTDGHQHPAFKIIRFLRRR